MRGVKKFLSFEVEVVVGGRLRQVAWDGAEGVLAISGVADHADALEIMDVLELTNVQPTDTGVSVATALAEFEQTKDAIQVPPPVTRGKLVEGVPPLTIQRDPEKAREHVAKVKAETARVAGARLAAGLKEAKAQEATPAPKAPAQVQTQGTAGPATTTPTGPEAGAPSASPSATTANSGEDLAVFGGFQKFAEVVAEIRKRGHNDYQGILVYCERLQKLGDVCPVVDQLGAQLVDRLKTHAANKQIPGVPAEAAQ